jgi:N utilization substance protein A
MKSDIVDAFTMMAKDKGIDRDILASVIKDSFTKMMEKKYGENANFEVIVNMEKGDIEIFLYKVVVEEVNDPNTEIDIETAKDKSSEDFEIGDDYVEEIPIEEFGRRMVINLKQNLNQKIREIEKEITYNKYKDQLGEIIVGEIYQIKPTSILLIHDGNEIIFPKSEQIPKERYKKGDTIRAIIKTIEKRPSGPPLIIVSRGDEQFLYKLFELEIPEIYDGIIEIKAIAREPGERAKIAVLSNDDRIDAVGACVGMKGIRIHSIVRELSNENIDVINYTEDPALYIARALSPAKLKDIYLDNENEIAKIYADEDQVSLVIGKGGQNIKLASKLTGYQIDVIRESEEEEEDIEDSELAKSLFKEKPVETGEEEVDEEAEAEESEDIIESIEEEAEETDLEEEIKEEGLVESTEETLEEQEEEEDASEKTGNETVSNEDVSGTSNSGEDKI